MSWAANHDGEVEHRPVISFCPRKLRKALEDDPEYFESVYGKSGVREIERATKEAERIQEIKSVGKKT